MRSTTRWATTMLRSLACGPRREGDGWLGGRGLGESRGRQGRERRSNPEGDESAVSHGVLLLPCLGVRAHLLTARKPQGKFPCPPSSGLGGPSGGRTGTPSTASRVLPGCGE